MLALAWQPFLAFFVWGARWRHLANATEPSMCGGDAALCQITLTILRLSLCVSSLDVVTVTVIAGPCG